MRRNFNIILFMLLLFGSCTEPYQHEITEFEDLLVVQGLLTNDPGPYSVYLSKTLSLYSDSTIFVEDAIVTITDQTGNIEVLLETEPGHYITNAGFNTQVGYEYQLNIETDDNLIYVSEPVRLMEGPRVDTLFTEYKEEYDFESNTYIEGIAIKLNSTRWSHEDELFMKWDLEETWELKQKWNGIEFIKGETAFEEFNGGQSDKSCWNTEYPRDIILDKTTNFSSKQVLGKEIIYLNAFNHKLHYGYSILVKQFVINESVYKFWTFLRENDIDNESVFNNVPYNPQSNIECINKNNVQVYGYFDAAYRSEKRLNLKSPVHDVQFANINDNCQAQYVPWGEFLRNVYGATSIYAININTTEMDASITFTIQKYCVDCTELCSQEEEPTFWVFK